MPVKLPRAPPAGGGAGRMATAQAWMPSHWSPIDAFPRDDDQVLSAHVRKQRPAVLRGGSIVPLSGWQEIDTLLATMSRTNVVVKRSRQERVAYFRTDRNSGRHEFDAESFVHESKVPFAEFVALADAARTRAVELRGANASRAASEEKTQPSRSRTSAEETGEETLYCQEGFTGHPELEKEFSGWDWAWVLQQCQRHDWGLPETNVLFMGSEGATTPAHFDEQHNFLNQVRGQKLVVLFPPEDYKCLYPFPVTHPCDRCSMVDVQRADLARFPRFAEAQGHFTTLGPGDVLYVPCGWWHYCRTESHLAASITFWAKAKGPTLSNIESQLQNLGLRGLLPGEEASRFPSHLLWRPRSFFLDTSQRRNLEDVGPPNLGEEVLRLLDLVEMGKLDDGRLIALRKILEMVQIPEEEQLTFISETFSGRFGCDLRQYV